MTINKYDVFNMKKSGAKYTEIANKYGVSRQRIHQIVKKGDAGMFPDLNLSGDWGSTNVIIYLTPDEEAKQYLADTLSKLSDEQFYMLVDKLKEIVATIPNNKKQMWRSCFAKEAIMI